MKEGSWVGRSVGSCHAGVVRGEKGVLLSAYFWDQYELVST